MPAARAACSRLTIPGFELRRWGPVAGELNLETIPALDIDVAANPDLVPRFDLDDAIDLAADRPLAVVAALSAIALLLWATCRWLPVRVLRVREWCEARRVSETAQFRTLLRVWRSNDPAAVYNAYVTWLAAAGLQPLLAQATDLAAELRHLQTALVQRDPTWRAGAFMRAVRRAAQQAGRDSLSRALPPLNP